MKITTTALAIAATLWLSAAPSLAAPTADHSRPGTPNSCIALNKGDWNACNVGNSGAGDKPYRKVVRPSGTPDACIALNKGDWNACNVGNSGAGDKPYRAVGAGATGTPGDRVEVDHSAWNGYNRRGGSLPYLLAQ